MNTNEIHERPDLATDAILKFLDTIHASGRIAMAAAPALLEAEFCLDYDEALVVLAYWVSGSVTGRKGTDL